MTPDQHRHPEERGWVRIRSVFEEGELDAMPSYYGESKHWHQDGFYYHIDPPDRGISVWLALHDADESNGCLSYCAGSHKLGLLPYYQPDGQPGLAGISMELSELGEPTPAPARRGDLLLHHFHTVHGSGANRCPFDRFAYASYWFDPSAKAGGPAWSRTYPLRADYRALVESESLR